MMLAAVAAGIVGALAVAAPASAHTAALSHKADCNTDTGMWEVNWTIHNDFHRAATLHDVTFTPAHDDGVVKNGAQLPASGDLKTETIAIPGTETGATLALKVKWADGFPVDKPEGQPYNDVITFVGKCAKRVEAAPTAKLTSACDGSATLTLGNEASSGADLSFTVTGKDFSKTVSVGAGKTVDVAVPAGAATAVTVTVGKRTFQLAWAKPANCGAPAPSLPKTGSKTGLMVGTGVLLLIAGAAALFVVRRRQRVTFVAE
jgi:LPXTG-motif cell wall-anchored protein